MQDSSIIIVGSGSSLCGSKLGAFIDQQDAILRFGGGETCIPAIGDLAEDVGSRTTHLIHNFNLAALRRFDKRINTQAGFYFNLDKIIFAHRGSHNVVSNCIALRNYNKFTRAGIDVEIAHIAEYVQQELQNYSVWLDEDTNESLKTIFQGMYNGDYNTTSGFFSVLRTINMSRYNKIYLCGFDSLLNSKPLNVDPVHFYGSPFELEFGHDLFNESRLILALKDHIDRIKILHTQNFPANGTIEIGYRINRKFEVKVLST